MAVKTSRPVRVIQFGEGNLLRGLVDDMIDIANERGVFDGNVAIVKPTGRGDLARFEAQDCLYTVLRRGKQGGRVVEERRIVTCIEAACHPYQQPDCLRKLAELDSARFIVSNTTEAGIVYDPADRFESEPPQSFPGKLTKLLFYRYCHVRGDISRGFFILPTELIERNGQVLRECVLRLTRDWKLDAGFSAWLDAACVFANTLVDRIVTGYPAAEAPQWEERLGYRDRLMTVCEPFALWVIECEDPEALRRQFPLDAAGCPVVFTADLRPYRERKVRILNGAHTTCVLAGFLCGKDIVRDLLADPLLERYLRGAMDEELAPTTPLPPEQTAAFAASVRERFENPYVDHQLLSIALNSVSKWRARILPSVKDTLRARQRLPERLTFSLAALLAFYTVSDWQAELAFGLRNGERYEIRDDAAVLAFLRREGAARLRDENGFVEKFLAQTEFWGEDLTQIPGFCALVSRDLQAIRAHGMRGALEALLERL